MCIILCQIQIQNDASTNIEFYKFNQDKGVLITVECVATEACISVS
jgi:hypothetical protein